MWLLRFIIGLFGIGYFIRHGVFDSNKSGLERVTYGFLALPLVWCYALFCIILVMIPIVFIGVALQDCPVIGVFLLIGVGLFAANVIKRFIDEKKENSSYDPSQGEFAKFVKKCKEDSDKREKVEKENELSKRLAEHQKFKEEVWGNWLKPEK